jgi:hypothetical protein
MGSVPEYREYARRCLEIADKTPQQRILLLEMARVWQERDQERSLFRMAQMAKEETCLVGYTGETQKIASDLPN